MELDQVSEFFEGKIPNIFSEMHRRRVLQMYWPSIAPVLGNGGRTNPVVVHALMVVLSTRCSNNYCFVMHSCMLAKHGLSDSEISTLVRELRLPRRIEGGERWGKLLELAFLAHTGSGEVFVDYLERLATAEEYREIAQICIAMGILNSFAEFYPENVSYRSDELLGEEDQLQLEIGDLVKYHEALAGDGLRATTKCRPVTTLCALCKRVRDREGHWYSLETVLATLERDTAFSHGYCEACHEKVREQVRRARSAGEA